MLAFSIESALTQSVSDLEVLVVGDACTDNTGEVVAGFDDDRLRFYNREINHGEQSAPNNDGVRRTNGELVAFLNHDDMWFPDHLKRAVAELDRTGWDGVLSAGARLEPNGRWSYLGPSHGGEVPAVRNYPCSCWLVRRKALERVGGFRDARQLRQPPSAEWIERARRLGCRFGGVPGVSLVMVPSGCRPDSYAGDSHPEHRKAHLLVQSPGGRETVLEQLLLDLADRRERPSARELLALAYRLWVAPILFRITRLSMGSQLVALRYPRKGAYLERLRRIRGLGPLPPLAEDPHNEE